MWFELQEFVTGDLVEQLTGPLLDQLLAVVAAERGAGLRAYGWRAWVETWPMDDHHPLASPAAFTQLPLEPGSCWTVRRRLCGLAT